MEELTANALGIMPDDWISELHQAAVQLNTQLLYQAIAQISQEQSSLAKALTDLADNFRYDTILNLTKIHKNNE